MDKNLYSDLACETFSESSNIIKNIRKYGDICAEEYIVSDDDGYLKKGKYTTVYTEKLWGFASENFIELKKIISYTLSEYLGCIGFSKIGVDDLFMIVGLGNPLLTPDSLGAKTVENIFVTSHFPRNVRENIKKPKVCAFTPDVTGNTGMETIHTIRAIIDKTEPKALIIVDSLASRGLERLARTVQISNVGLIPGSGIGEARAAIDEGSIKIPIISIGVPTVIRLSTAIYSVCSELVANMDTSSFEAAKDFFVCPKDIDRIVSSSSLLIAEALNESLMIDI